MKFSPINSGQVRLVNGYEYYLVTDRQGKANGQLKSGVQLDVYTFVTQRGGSFVFSYEDEDGNHQTIP